MTLDQALQEYHPGYRLMVEWPVVGTITRKVCVSVWPKYSRAPLPPDTVVGVSERLPGLETEEYAALRAGDGWSLEKLGEEGNRRDL